MPSRSSSDDGKVTTFKLTPRKKGNVDHIDAKVSDLTATVESMQWNYDNGGYAEMNKRTAKSTAYAGKLPERSRRRTGLDSGYPSTSPILQAQSLAPG